ncbi:putative 5' nucleotidase family protein [Monocercomonoides exilis]|uniref:putative 5' nucleotidase family protein n=1 Tax=Monocercomonoides exilis TaxID=2049356 RepID=UPI00355AC686|nr:putative 5' nucleotidase family protein [Monocercomonoides exilis]|eukprot:MONOS_8300.1-p1 / transcript=MONOS_8300.1 / gene=MONOS_8300 / organism=Monocercomonoides_exilis_PA203 / gene_product=5' nucleotidase family protein / transcript_product=5' nucleotidase family protein / location=Mono_scaffold00309:54836-57090(+) / protein_length=604 / sequence_SO=supercontig / SO=protein_coding / is_pseudo=false
MLSTVIFSLLVVIRFTFCEEKGLNITIIHTTDMHGWVNGHPHEPTMNANLGDIYNYMYHMKQKQGPQSKVMAFDTGDYSQGTGLSDATPIQGEFIFKVIQKMPYDGLCIGNHELKTNPCIDNVANNVVPFWKGRYLAINVHHINSSKKMGDRYFTLDLPNGKGKVLVFGWLLTWNSHDTNAYVTKVETSLKESFFNEAFAIPNVKLIICLCHIDTTNPEVELIRKFMKKNKPSVPVVMLTGHSHKKRTFVPSTSDYEMESDHYSRCLGLLNFVLPDALLNGNVTNADSLNITYKQQFLTTNVAQMQASAGIRNSSQWDTPTGLAIKAELKKKNDELHLSEVIGCSPKQYAAKDLYPIMVNKVLPSRFKFSTKFVYTMKNNVMRYPLYKGQIVYNDIFTIDPFNYSVRTYSNVKGEHLKKLAPLLNEYYFSDNLKSLNNSSTFELIHTMNEEKKITATLDTIARGVYKPRDLGYWFRPIFVDYVRNYMKCGKTFTDRGEGEGEETTVDVDSDQMTLTSFDEEQHAEAEEESVGATESADPIDEGEQHPKKKTFNTTTCIVCVVSACAVVAVAGVFVAILMAKKRRRTQRSLESVSFTNGEVEPLL